MLKARSRKISMLLVLAMLMTMFVGIGTASAATYSTSTIPTVSKAAGQDLGPVIIDFPILNAGYHKAIIKLPGSFVVNGTVGTAVNSRVSDLTDSSPFSAASSTPINDEEYNLTLLSGNQLQFEIQTSVVHQNVKFAILLNDVTVPNGADNEINVTIMKLDGDFTDGALTVAKITGGAVDVLHSDPGTLQAGESASLLIHIRQDVSGALAQGNDALKIKLPKGVTWGTVSIHTFPGIGADLNDGINFTLDTTDDSVLKINKKSADDKNTYTVDATIVIDEEEAAFGDIVATISGKSTVNNSTLKLGTYKDYGYTVTVGQAEELVAGLGEQEVAKVTVKENINGSLLPGRTVIVKLPDGVRFAESTFTANAKAGNMAVSFTRSSSDPSKATGRIANTKSGKGEMDLQVLVDVAVDFKGDITLQFSGSAGIEETVKVAEVVAPITASADAKEVKIGVQGQEAGSIVITETKAEAIQSRIWDAANSLYEQTYIDLTAPYGVTWDRLPKVEVIEGDIDLGTPTRLNAANGKHVLRIPVKSQSRVASKIQISNVVYSLDRTVPEGDLKVAISGTALDQVAMTNRTTAASVVAAKVVTPAPGETVGNGEFRIGSNIYYVGGAAKVMDVAPYIKGARTYVPMRYVAEILGAEVVWDDAARTVTLTKGDDVVVFTIDSTTYTVNGEAKTADVAPEISNARTMLPARYVAESFGAVVGWDPATQTVLIQK